MQNWKETFSDWYVNKSGQNYMPVVMLIDFIEENILEPNSKSTSSQPSMRLDEDVNSQIKKQYEEKGNRLSEIVGVIPDLQPTDEPSNSLTDKAKKIQEDYLISAMKLIPVKSDEPDAGYSEDELWNDVIGLSYRINYYQDAEMETEMNEKIQELKSKYKLTPIKSLPAKDDKQDDLSKISSELKSKHL